MSDLLYAALVAVLTVQPNLHISTIPAPIVTVVSETAAQTVTNELRGWTECATTRYPDGRVTGKVLKVTAIPTGDTLEHEVLHAVDCLDNGVMDGSLLPFKPTQKDASHEWVYWAQANPEQAIAIMEGLTK